MSYEVYHKLSSTTAWPTTPTATVTTTSRTITGLTNGSTYNFRVRARTGAGTVANPYKYSGYATVNAIPNIQDPSTPTNLAGAPSSGQVALSWTASNANGGTSLSYEVYHKLSSTTAWPTTPTATITTTSRTITGLTNGSTYNFRVRARTGAGTVANPYKYSGYATVNAIPNAQNTITLSLNTPATVTITNGGRREVKFTAPSTGTYTFTSSDQSPSSLDPKAYTYATGATFLDDDSAGNRNYKFQQTLNVGEIFTYYSGVYSDSNASIANGSYKVTVTSAAATKYTLTNSVSNARITPSGANTLTHNTTYVGTLEADSGYIRPATINVLRGSTNINSYITYNSSTGEITIPATQVTGAITISGAALAPTNVTVNLYAASNTNSSTYTTIANDAAYSFNKQFNLKMNNINIIKGTVNLEDFKIGYCQSHWYGEGLCDIPTYHKDHFYQGGIGTLTKYYDIELIGTQFFNSLNNGGKGLNTLFVDYYLYLGGCQKCALGFAYLERPSDVIVCSRDLQHPGFNNQTFLSFRVLQHEWTHSYGLDFDPYEYKDTVGDARKCQGDCIMMADYCDNVRDLDNVWCYRCKRTIQTNLKIW